MNSVVFKDCSACQEMIEEYGLNELIMCSKCGHYYPDNDSECERENCEING